MVDALQWLFSLQQIIFIIKICPEINTEETCFEMKTSDFEEDTWWLKELLWNMRQSVSGTESVSPVLSDFALR